jgi:N-acetylmuramoyl-L-alanine amidase
MRKIDKIIIHCSATQEGRNFTVQDIDAWHKQRGFAKIGYHKVIYQDGSIHDGRPLSRMGAHCLGHNATSIGICYIGGLDTNGNPKDTRTPAQKKALYDLLAELKAQFPDATVHGHNEFAAKACPCFNVKTQL